MSNILGISRFARNDNEWCKALPALVIARSPSGRRGNLPSSNEEIASPAARNDISLEEEISRGVYPAKSPTEWSGE